MNIAPNATYALFRDGIVGLLHLSYFVGKWYTFDRKPVYARKHEMGIQLSTKHQYRYMPVHLNIKDIGKIVVRTRVYPVSFTLLDIQAASVYPDKTHYIFTEDIIENGGAYQKSINILSWADPEWIDAGWNVEIAVSSIVVLKPELVKRLSEMLGRTEDFDDEMRDYHWLYEKLTKLAEE